MARAQRILVVEDDEAIQEMVCTALRYAGYAAFDAINGKIALSCVDRYKPDLIILDMHMPVMDGWEFLAEYRASRRPEIPVVAVSAQSSHLQTIPRVAAFLTKPFDLNHLVGVVHQLLGKYAQV